MDQTIKLPFEVYQPYELQKMKRPAVPELEVLGAGLSRHPLHELIGRLVMQLDGEIPNMEIVRDKACGGRRHIQMFVKDVPSNKSRVCKVDMMILLNGKVKVLFEIEESNISLVQICGKATISRLASHCIHKKISYPKAAIVHFIQFVACSACEETTTTPSKVEQLRNVAPLLKELLGSSNFTHQIFYGLTADFQSEPERLSVLDDIREALSD